jgi:hypothetical protein
MIDASSFPHATGLCCSLLVHSIHGSIEGILEFDILGSKIRCNRHNDTTKVSNAVQVLTELEETSPAHGPRGWRNARSHNTATE